MRKPVRRSSKKKYNTRTFNVVWPSPSFFFLSFDAMIGPLLFDQGQADGCGHSTKTTVAWAIGLMATFVSTRRRNPYRDFPPPPAVSHSRFRSVFAILGFWEFWDEKRFLPIFAETLDQERAQVPLWGPAPVSGATFLLLG